MLEEQALQLIQDSLSSLHRAGLLDQAITASDNTILLGSGSLLDSIGFVTFVTDLEERLSSETEQEVYLVLNDIQDFNTDSSFLSVGILARYIATLASN